MRHLQSLQLVRDVLVEAHMELVDAMRKDPHSPIHYLDHTPNIFRRIDEAIRECDTYNLNKGK